MGPFFGFGATPPVHEAAARGAALRAISESGRAWNASKRRSCRAAIDHLINAAFAMGTASANRETGGNAASAVVGHAYAVAGTAERAVLAACGAAKRKAARKAAKKTRKAAKRSRGRRRDARGRFI